MKSLSEKMSSMCGYECACRNVPRNWSQTEKHRSGRAVPSHLPAASWAAITSPDRHAFNLCVSPPKRSRIADVRKITFIFIATQFVVLQAQVEPAATSSFSQENFGTVHFQTSCSESVRPSFERAVAMLHSFSYEAAAQEFGLISKRDPECAMAHWGSAMALWHELWNRPARPLPSFL